MHDGERHSGKVFNLLAVILISSMCASCVHSACMDCDYCWPNPNNSIGQIEFGVNQDNIATVVLSLYKAGKCEDEDADHFWLLWNSGSISVEIHNTIWILDESVVEIAGGEHRWLDRPLRVVVLGGDLTQVRLDFIENGIQTIVRCSMVENDIACAIE